MADRIAILGGEPYDEWIERDGTAQYLFKAYLNKWPEGTAACFVAGDDFYVRFHDGKMRYVDYVNDFDNEAEWCAQCGVPVDIDSREYYCCDADGCDAVLCDHCGGSMTGDYCCPRHRLNGMLQEDREPRYTYPYALGDDNQFTYGVEIELESELPEDFVKNVVDSDLIAGWNNDPSLGQNGVELQSNILDMSKLSDLRQLVEGIPDYGENAGGHIHVARTANQCASRWYWALRGLDESQCEHLNMRHMSDDYWCELSHGEYRGKHTAVNNEHSDTIELRTFDCWYEGSAAKLVPAVKWIRAMWRFFEKHPRGTVKAENIEQYASCMADNVTDTPRLTLEERLEAVRHMAAAAAFEQRRIRRERAAETRRRVEDNIRRSRLARASHGDTRTACRDWAYHENSRARQRENIEVRLHNPAYAYVLPSRNLRPLHIYLQMATARIVGKGETFRSLDLFRIYHAADGSPIWEGYVYSYNHGNAATRVLENILRSRVARASHGKPTTESLERTALRLYKRAGRPELNMRYAQIRKNIAQENAE